jgi:hypothetical protein
MTRAKANAIAPDAASDPDSGVPAFLFSMSMIAPNRKGTATFRAYSNKA